MTPNGTFLEALGMGGYDYAAPHAFRSHWHLWTIGEAAHRLAFRALLELVGRQVQTCLDQRVVEHRGVFATGDKGEVSHICEYGTSAIEQMLRISMDARATVKIGSFARGGKSRVLTKAADHDFHAQARVTPVGIFLPCSDEFYLYAVTSKVTSDCLVDRLVDWWETVKERFSHITTLLINLDNDPENQSRRTQFMQRLVEFVQCSHITVRLAYYPPYHSKYNPIERCWGILEQHWNGALLDSVDAVVQYASTMTWKRKHPLVELVTTTYQTGVKLTKEAMKVVETQLERWPSLEKWFVDIRSFPPAIRAESQAHAAQPDREGA